MRKLSSYLLSVLALLLCTTQVFATEASEQVRWPVPDWENFDNTERLKTKECRNFLDFAVNGDNFLTDGLIIIKDGMVHYEFYDSKHGPNTPHVMWSVSKTITAALLGIAENEGRINLDSELRNYYPKPDADENYQKITIKNLLYMDTGFYWDEDEVKIDRNPMVKMLYGTGHKDMAEFASSRKIIKEGPSYKWNYSTGIPTITMGVLKKVYGQEDIEMPWRNLFNPLGMKSAVFERDQSGTFIGGSSFFVTPRDLAKLGYLYLNNGHWNGEILLPPEWIKKMLTPSPGYLSSGTIITDVVKDGVYGGSIWLNKETKKGKGRQFPNVPEDMYLALGFNGQLLIVIPSLKMIIVRTGHDLEFRSKLNEFMSRAIQCFEDPNHKIGSSGPTKTIKMGLGTLIKNVKNGIEANTLQASIAKTICSCHFISGIDIPSCVKRNNFTMSKLFTKISVKQNKEKDNRQSIQVRLSRFARLFKLHFGNSTKAFYSPDKPFFGCSLQ
ncbi:MAG: serine hydrolase [Bacteriovorax sp.]|jgi:CubicO group peptidase (beta-lactamase class C family)